ncbi:MAG TPA: phosphoglycolate phosphatase [Burkholderiaceae bacterium]|nr:phosphoglycolate phosphatase [Burkholderiaceae bacterium]
MKASRRAVLFDLDGTLIDSAPDLAAAANGLRSARGLPPLPYEFLRPMVGAGARGMVGVAFGVAPGEPEFEPLKKEFLSRYEEGLLMRTRVFQDMERVLSQLDSRHVPWGIVTNKAKRFADPVVRGLGLQGRAAVVICGDTTPHSKPHPEPLLEAARRLAVAPVDCIYIGDDLRDVQAGRAAGMGVLAAAWGYLGQGESIEKWGADAVLQHPLEVLRFLDVA